MNAEQSRSRVFFCYCCGVHYRCEACHMCNGSACYRCIAWAHECYQLGDAWCARMHFALRNCVHPPTSADHQVLVSAAR